MDQQDHGLIPPPGLVREILARNYEDADLLRRLLRLSETAAERAGQRRLKDRPDREAVSR
jgi:hypothetical protein